MNPPRIWQIALSLAGIATVSALAGGLIGHRIARRHYETRNDPAQWNVTVAHRFEALVHPTPDQSAKIQIHLDNAVRQLQSVRLETIAKSTNIIFTLVAQVEQELTPEQKKAFEPLRPKTSDLNLNLLNVKP